MNSYKSLIMKNKERILFSLVIITSLSFAFIQKYFNSKLDFLLETYKAETRIQSSEIFSLQNSLFTQGNLQYQKGFEDGKTQMGFAFISGNNMFNYSDGYHTAIRQFGSEEYNKIIDFNKNKLIQEVHTKDLSEELDNLNSASKN